LDKRQETVEPYVYQLFTGKVKKLGDPDAKHPMKREWKSGIFKKPTSEKVWLSKTGLANDQQADKKNHGGPEKAVFAYPMKHYTYWQNQYHHQGFKPGAMGENLAVQNMDESTVCIGDRYQLGDTIIQVSQPRRPCWKPARRFQIKDLSWQIQNSGLTGWYFRVLKEGYISSESVLQLMERPHPKWTIENCNEVMYVHKDNRKLTEELASCEDLAINWKRTLTKRLRGKTSNDAKRLYGPNADEQ
jgi:MOSC domain-containing protein YiiM